MPYEWSMPVPLFELELVPSHYKDGRLRTSFKTGEYIIDRHDRQQLQLTGYCHIFSSHQLSARRPALLQPASEGGRVWTG